MYAIHTWEIYFKMVINILIVFQLKIQGNTSSCRIFGETPQLVHDSNFQFSSRALSKYDVEKVRYGQTTAKTAVPRKGIIITWSPKQRRPTLHER